MEIIEGSLIFSFNENVDAIKYDEVSFYRNQFNHTFNGTKAMDILALDKDKSWLIEVKDYRIHRRTKLIDLSEEVAIKVRDTLAGLVAMKFNANQKSECQFAKDFLKQKQLKVVLHLEQAKTNSKLFPQVANPVVLQQKLRSILKAVDAHPIVLDLDKTNANQHKFSWKVESK